MGLEREYPDLLPLSNQLNDLGRSMRAELTNACTNDILRVGAGRSASQVSTSTSLLSSPEVRKVMDDNSVELYPGVPTAPVFEWHTPDDVLIPIDSVVNTISRYCAAGATIQSQLFPSPDHLTTAVLGLPTRIPSTYRTDSTECRPRVRAECLRSDVSSRRGTWPTRCARGIVDRMSDTDDTGAAGNGDYSLDPDDQLQPEDTPDRSRRRRHSRRGNLTTGTPTGT